MKKPVWREIRTSVMVPIDSGNIAYQDYYPIHLDRFARSVDSLKEMEKITDAQEGDLVKVRSARKMYVCTEAREIKEPRQKGWWIEIKLDGVITDPWTENLDWYFDLTPGCRVRCGDRFFDEDERVIVDSIEERDRLDGIEDGQYVRVGNRLFLYIDDNVNKIPKPTKVKMEYEVASKSKDEGGDKDEKVKKMDPYTLSCFFVDAVMECGFDDREEEEKVRYNLVSTLFSDYPEMTVKELRETMYAAVKKYVADKRKEGGTQPTIKQVLDTLKDNGVDLWKLAFEDGVVEIKETP